MLYGDHYKRIVHCFPEFVFDIPDGVSERWCSIRQKDLEPIIRYHHCANVDQALIDTVPQVHDVTNQHVAARGYLQLNSKTNKERLVVKNGLCIVTTSTNMDV